MENYKVVILSAGIGSRMKEFTKHFNKALIPLLGKPVICHIIEKIPKDVEIVIAGGYLKENLFTYLKIAYPERKFIFVNVDKYEGVGTGPGYSLLCCKNHLQCPFIYESADTLFLEEIPEPNENWFGIAKVKDTSRFCSAKIDSTWKIIKIDDKIKTDNEHAFIGLGGVKDYNVFWDALSTNKNLISGEFQVSNGFSALIERNMIGKIFSWFDVGTPESYNYALKNYPSGKAYRGENE